VSRGTIDDPHQHDQIAQRVSVKTRLLLRIV